VRVLDAQCPAAKAGVQPNDMLLAVNGQRVPGKQRIATPSRESVDTRTRELSQTDITGWAGDDKGLGRAVSLISSSGEQPVALQLRRDGKVIEKSVTPRLNPQGRGSIGILMAASVERSVSAGSSPVVGGTEPGLGLVG
jgi:C-terminal processing protease CtpA/Prc